MAAIPQTAAEVEELRTLKARKNSLSGSLRDSYKRLSEAHIKASDRANRVSCPMRFDRPSMLERDGQLITSVLEDLDTEIFQILCVEVFTKRTLPAQSSSVANREVSVCMRFASTGSICSVPWVCSRRAVVLVMRLFSEPSLQPAGASGHHVSR